MYTVRFDFEQKGLAPRVLNDVKDGQTLLELALKNRIALHHDCGGACICSTCHIYVSKGMEHIARISNREEDFIGRAINPALHSRLGCQSLLLAGRGEIRVTIPDQARLSGE